jgi:hypothetical protein
MKEAAIRFVRAANPADEYSVVLGNFIYDRSATGLPGLPI